MKRITEKLNYYLISLKTQAVIAAEDNQGIGTVEMILILVVLIGLVLVFKEKLGDLVNSIFKTITDQAGKV